MSPQKQEIVTYRRQKAKDTLNAARVLLDSESLSAAVNRVYYAVFYEVMALLLAKDLKPTTHTGTKALFNQHVIKAGLVNASWGRFYSSIFDHRQEADYTDFVELDSVKVRQWFNQASEFIACLEKLFE